MTQFFQPEKQKKTNNEISLLKIINICVKHLRLFVIVPSFFCTITIIYVFLIAEPVFTSSAKIMSGSKKSAISRYAGIASTMGIDLSGSGDHEWVYRDILLSRRLAKKVLNTRFDTDAYGKQKQLKNILSQPATESQDEKIIEYNNIRMLIEDMIEVFEDINTRIYTIKLHASEPKLANDILESLIKELDLHQKDYNRMKSSKTRQFVESRIIETRKELEKSEEELKDFRDRNRRIENSPALLLEQQRLVREVAVLTGVFTTLKQQLETVKIEEVRDSDYVIVVDPPMIPIYKSKPRRKILVLMAGFLGIGLAFIYVLFLESFRNINNKEKQLMNETKKIFIQQYNNTYNMIRKKLFFD